MNWKFKMIIGVVCLLVIGVIIVIALTQSSTPDVQITCKNGKVVDNKCLCNDGWSGDHCDKKELAPPIRIEIGDCKDNKYCPKVDLEGACGLEAGCSHLWYYPAQDRIVGECKTNDNCVSVNRKDFKKNCEKGMYHICDGNLRCDAEEGTTGHYPKCAVDCLSKDIRKSCGNKICPRGSAYLSCDLKYFPFEKRLVGTCDSGPEGWNHRNTANNFIMTEPCEYVTNRNGILQCSNSDKHC